MFKPVYITGLAAFLPNDPVDNDEIEDLLGMIDGRPSRAKKRILESNGIKTRYYAIDRETGQQTHTNAQLTAEAIRLLSRNAHFPLDRIECLACGTAGPDQLVPNHALMVHAEIACPPCEVISTAGVCCSSIAALKYGFMSVACGLTTNAVVTGGELVSNAMRGKYFAPEIQSRLNELADNPYLNFEKDFLRWMLSDAAAALLLEDSPRDDRISLRVDWIDYISFATELEPCMYGGCIKRPDGSLLGWRDTDDPEDWLREGFFALKQDVRLLRKHMAQKGSEGFERIREKHELQADAIDWFLPHYSSEYFRQEVFDRLCEADFVIPFERWFTNLSYKGNTGSASLFVILEELVASGKAKRGDRILCFVPESARFSYAYMHLTAV
jgi:3-oxoacyl-[acyl-carrier-protein] synthase-3